MSETKYLWTNHALQRLKERKISEELLTRALTFPDRKLRKDDRTTEFQKRIAARTVAVIVKRNERGENIIISSWINPPFPGTQDFRKRNRYLQIRKSHGFKKLWQMLLYKLGI